MGIPNGEIVGKATVERLDESVGLYRVPNGDGRELIACMDARVCAAGAIDDDLLGKSIRRHRLQLALNGPQPPRLALPTVERRPIVLDSECDASKRPQ